MAQKVMFQGPDGGVGTLHPLNQGNVLIGSASGIRQTSLDAANVVYTSNASGLYPSVSAALDALVQRTESTGTVASALAESIAAVETSQQKMATRIMSSMANLESGVSGQVKEARRSAHKQLTRELLSNPALSVDVAAQTVTLDLSEPGSYDDSRTMIGRDSIQSAIESLHMISKTVEVKVAEVNQQLVALRSAQSDLRRELSNISTRVSTLESA